MKNRDVLLDVMKGVGIILVVFAHTLKAEVSSVVYLFHMPLFFLLSGCALAYSSRKIKVGVKGYFKSLIVPYIVFSLITYIYWVGIEWRFRPSDIPALFEGSLGMLDIRTQELLNIFTAYSVMGAFEYNVVLWFLPCLFCCMVVYKWMKLRLGKILPAGVVCLAALYFAAHSLIPVLPWCFEIAMVALPFVWIGDACYAKAKVYSNLGGCILALLIIVIMMLWQKPCVDMRIHTYGGWWQFYLVALSFIIPLMRLCMMIEPFEFGILQWLGRNSLVIMCVHEPIKRIVLKLFSISVGIDITTIRSSVIASLLVTAIIITIIYPLTIAINRYAPILIGRSKVNTI